MSKRLQQGFTLIELMLVVAVIGILAAIAYPSYVDQIVKGRRAQGRTAIMELLQQQERYMTQNNCYLGFTTSPAGVASALAPVPATACGGVTATAVPFKNYSGDQGPAGAAYLLSAQACTSGSNTLPITDCVQVDARPVTPDPEVGTLSMTSTGTKACSGTASTTNFKLCWP